MGLFKRDLPFGNENTVLISKWEDGSGNMLFTLLLTGIKGKENCHLQV